MSDIHAEAIKASQKIQPPLYRTAYQDGYEDGAQRVVSADEIEEINKKVSDLFDRAAIENYGGPPDQGELIESIILCLGLKLP